MSTTGEGPSGPKDGPAPDRDIEQLTRLAALRREGVLTDEEFEAKKREILDVPGRRRSRQPWSKRRKVVTGTAAAVVILGGAGTGVGMKLHNDSVARKEALAAKLRAEAQDRAEEKAREARVRAAERKAAARRAADRLEIATRRLIVKDLRKSVTDDFEGRVSDGFLDGPILDTSCDPVGGGIADLEVRTGKFECLVATEELGGGRVRGYSVDATINYTKGSYTWKMSA